MSISGLVANAIKIKPAKRKIILPIAIEISKENQGKGKGLGRIGGCLLGYAALLSDEYGHEGFIGLIAKNKKAKLFHEKFGFQYIGSIAVLGERMASDTANSVKLIKEYINKKN